MQKDLVTLTYQRYTIIRGDMIMVFKSVTGIMDRTISCNFINSHSVTRRTRYKLTQKRVHYNLTQFSFANRIVSIWTSLLVVSACSIGVFENIQICSEETKIACTLGKPL